VAAENIYNQICNLLFFIFMEIRLSAIQ